MVMKRSEKIGGLTQGGRQKNLKKTIAAMERKGWRYAEYNEAGRGKSFALFEKDERATSDSGKLILLAVLGFFVLGTIGVICSETSSNKGGPAQQQVPAKKQASAPKMAPEKKQAPAPEAPKPAPAPAAAPSATPAPAAAAEKEPEESPEKVYLDAAEVTKKWAALEAKGQMAQRTYMVDELDEKPIRWVGTYVKTSQEAIDEGLHWFMVEGMLVMVDGTPSEPLVTGKTYALNGKIDDDILLADYELGKPRRGDTFSIIIIVANELKAAGKQDLAAAKEALLRAIAARGDEPDPSRPLVAPIGVSYDQVLGDMREYFKIQQVKTGEVPPRYLGITEDSLAIIEITGDKPNILKATLAFSLPVDRKEVALRNTMFAATMFRNCDPTWKDSLQWLTDKLPGLLELPGMRIWDDRGDLRFEAEFNGELGLVFVNVRHK